jgi:hypothetical protein
MLATMQARDSSSSRFEIQGNANRARPEVPNAIMPALQAK